MSINISFSKINFVRLIWYHPLMRLQILFNQDNIADVINFLKGCAFTPEDILLRNKAMENPPNIYEFTQKLIGLITVHKEPSWWRVVPCKVPSPYIICINETGKHDILLMKFSCTTKTDGELNEKWGWWVTESNLNFFTKWNKMFFGRPSSEEQCEPLL